MSTLKEALMKAGNTTNTADNHPNSTKPRHRNSTDENRFKNTDYSQEYETNMYQGKYGSTALD